MFLSISNNKKEKDRVSQLADIIAAMSVSKDIKELLELALSRTLQALSSDRGSIFLAGEDGKELFLKWAYNINSEEKNIREKVGEGIAGKVAENMEPVLVKDIRHDPRFNFRHIYNNYKTRSFLCVPIAIDVKLIGVINITENRSNKPYSEKDLKFLKIIADHIALKIEKSRLLSEIGCLRKKTENDTKFADIGKFSSGISHELSNPLDGVIRYTNLALEAIEDSAAKEYLLEARTGLNRITNIIRSLLALTRYEKPSSPKLIDINKSIEASIDFLRYQAMCKAVDIVKLLSPNLPRIPDFGLDSVFSNIFKNSLDALDEKGSITISTALEHGFIKISIRDTGCGIPKDNMDCIFEPFFTTKSMGKGSGLGLSICYDIVKRYNGKIDVSSEPNKGAAFTVYIPCEGSK